MGEEGNGEGHSMTTIVANRTSMAADKRITGGPMFKTTKIYRIRGSLIGFAGNVEQALRFIEWRRTPETKPAFAETINFQAIELTPEGKLVWWGAEMVGIPIEGDCYAIGSGSAFALGAMEMGATPKQAIQIAARWDDSTGTDVQSMTLGGKQ